MPSLPTKYPLMREHIGGVENQSFGDAPLHCQSKTRESGVDVWGAVVVVVVVVSGGGVGGCGWWWMVWRLW